MTKSNSNSLFSILNSREHYQVKKPEHFVDVSAFKGSRNLMKQSNFIVGIHRSKNNLPWWKKVWYRIFGFPTPRYEEQNYD